MMAVVCLSVHLSVCHVPRPNWRTIRPRKPKFGRMEGHHMGNPRTYLEVRKSKVKVTRSINAVTDNAQYADQGYYNFLKISVFILYCQSSRVTALFTFMFLYIALYFVTFVFQTVFCCISHCIFDPFSGCWYDSKRVYVTL